MTPNRTDITRRMRRALGAGLIALAAGTASLPAKAESVLQYIPTLKPSASLRTLPLQNRFLGLDRQYQALSPATRLHLAPQRNDLKLSIESADPASAMDSIELESKIDRYSQRLSVARRFPTLPVAPIPTVK